MSSREVLLHRIRERDDRMRAQQREHDIERAHLRGVLDTERRVLQRLRGDCTACAMLREEITELRQRLDQLEGRRAAGEPEPPSRR